MSIQETVSGHSIWTAISSEHPLYLGTRTTLEPAQLVQAIKLQRESLK